MNQIEINRVGKILSGDNAGWYIIIESDEKRSGGYFIYQAPIPQVKSSDTGFDDWLEKYSDIDAYINESSWEIDWL